MTIDEVRAFIMEKHAQKEIPGMMDAQDKARGLAQWIGERVNECEEKLSKEEAEVMTEVMMMDEMTETLRKTILRARTAVTRRELQDAKLLYHRLLQTEKMLAQAIKTLREQPI